MSKIVKIYVCDKCEKEFTNKGELLVHVCSTLVEFTCECCGERTEWLSSDIHAVANENRCHHINLGSMGYGCHFDGHNVKLKVCDDCLFDWKMSFKLKSDFELDVL